MSLHIVSAFDEDIQHLRGLILRMGGMVEKLCREAFDAFSRGDGETAAELIEFDNQVDALEMEVYNETNRILALRSPVASDLRVVFSAVRIAGNLERAGDKARNNAKRAGLVNLSDYAGLSRVLQRMNDTAVANLHDTLTAYTNADLELAEAILLRDEELDTLFNTIFNNLMDALKTEEYSVDAMTQLMFVAKNIERIGDITTNIAEIIIYEKTGQIPEDTRPKADALLAEMGK